MLFAYIPNDGVYLAHEATETLDSELYLTFSELDHPLNKVLINFFKNQPGFFHYDVSIMYIALPFEIISLEKFPELCELAFRIEKGGENSYKMYHPL